METAHILLAEIWFAILGLFLIFYVVLDGFDLGIGIISLVAKSEQRRNVMMSSVGSVWDANETWLVVFGGALFGAFPVAYGSILHGLYIPVSLMLFALIFRGISFEFREHGEHKGLWSQAFGYGSLIAALAQGFALGAVIGGFPVENGEFVGSVWHWLSLFSLLTALGVVFGYVLLGACYLIMKTSGEIQQRMYRIATIGAVMMAICGLAVSIWTPLRFEYVYDRWFNWLNLFWLAPLPLLAIGAFGMLLRSLYLKQEHAPFVWSVLIFVFSFLGLAVTLFPYLVPDVLSIFDAAARPNTLVFMLTGIGMLIPIMIIYNAYQYLVFRGKVSEQEGYE
ncbi:MAG: cytochrome d ubiquinol oxidase subunit II [Thiohalophilus sp.]|jgi:cytochrome d ubiquinol oxidase subunit II